MLYLSLEGTDYMEVVPFLYLLRPTPFSDQLLSYRPLIQCLIPVYQLFFHGIYEKAGYVYNFCLMETKLWNVNIKHQKLLFVLGVLRNVCCGVL